MNKKEELKHTNQIVKKILIDYPLARGCDPYLYIRVMKVLCPEACKMNFADVMLNLKDLGLPCFETVRRTRADIQSKHPELKPSEEIQKYRNENEEIYKEFFS